MFFNGFSWEKIDNLILIEIAKKITKNLLNFNAGKNIKFKPLWPARMDNKIVF